MKLLVIGRRWAMLVVIAMVMSSAALAQEAIKVNPELIKQKEEKAPGRIAFLGKNTRHENQGWFEKWKFTKVDIPGDDYTKGSVELEIDLTSIKTENDKLTAHLKNQDFFDVDKFPKAKLKVFEAKPVPDKPNFYTAKCTIEIGERKAELPLQFQVNTNDVRHIQGLAVVPRSDIKVGEPFDPGNTNSIENAVRVKFEAHIPADTPKEDAAPAEAPEAAPAE